MPFTLSRNSKYFKFYTTLKFSRNGFFPADEKFFMKNSFPEIENWTIFVLFFSLKNYNIQLATIYASIPGENAAVSADASEDVALRPPNFPAGG